MCGNLAKKRTVRRPHVLLTLTEAAEIAGGVDALFANRSEATKSTWRRARGPDGREIPIVPLSSVAPFLLEWWRDKWQPMVASRVAEERRSYQGRLDRAREALEGEEQPPESARPGKRTARD